ncbi:MmgE/PrpD family protein [Sabulicella glaciei]|uniref:MmgE/PrpD family protein n=1 Tax=Sabulicella glaciei TaxID=2984948 RepID=A0ABT3NTV7_9PROT|nr:MmgE/PrpD family protein [Roseococcus sp. MDT2-1-1]MCW8085579.1 MmgE/PrpD family protein [Roseococcus sp. MDT2-1-1]
MTMTRRIAEFAAGFDARSVGGTERDLTLRAMLDTVAVAVAARKEPAAILAEKRAVALGSGPCRLWKAQASPGVGEEGAAWANGVIGHVLDFDDVTSAMRGHPSIALLPGVLALSETEGRTVGEATAAYVVGFEVICALSVAMAQPHYVAGWHSTATIGAIGAAAACGWLLRLDATRMAHALGLAAAQAAGTRASFGTMAKSFQAGQANLVGLRSARLAQIGFDAAPDGIGGPMGFLALYHAGDAHELPPFGGALERHGLEVKKYPMCYATHRALDALLALRREEGLSLSDVRSVEVRASAASLAPLIHHRPQTGLDAKFSMEYAVAAALLDGAVRLSSFEDDAVLREEVQRFLPRVSASEAGGELLPRWAEVTLRLQDGRVLSRRQDALRGAADEPLSEAELLEKAEGCLRHGGAPPGTGEALLAALRQPDARVAEVLSLVVS